MSKTSDGFSVNLAKMMVQMADRPTVLWGKHEITPYPDDDPENRRHLEFLVTRKGFNDIRAECYVHKDHGGNWSSGSVIVGHSIGTHYDAYINDPECFFKYHPIDGLTEVRKVPVEFVPDDFGKIRAQVLDDPDVSPSRRDERTTALPFALGHSRAEAIGDLILKNPDLFQCVIRDRLELRDYLLAELEGLATISPAMDLQNFGISIDGEVTKCFGLRISPEYEDILLDTVYSYFQNQKLEIQESDIHTFHVTRTGSEWVDVVKVIPSKDTSDYTVAIWRIKKQQ